MRYGITYVVTCSTLFPLVVFICPFVVLAYPLVILVSSLSVLVCPLVPLVCPLVFPLVVFVCSLVIFVWSCVYPFVVLVVASVGLFKTDQYKTDLSQTTLSFEERESFLKNYFKSLVRPRRTGFYTYFGIHTFRA